MIVQAGMPLVHFPGGLADYAVLVDKTGHDEPADFRRTCRARSRPFAGAILRLSPTACPIQFVGEKHVPVTKHGHGW